LKEVRSLYLWPHVACVRQGYSVVVFFCHNS
jgi:hypothetical protein